MFSPEIMKLAAECEARLAPMFRAVDETAFYNTGKVLDVFREHRLSERHFNPSCGYGYNDDGRDLCDTLYAAAFGCEAALPAPSSFPERTRSPLLCTACSARAIRFFPSPASRMIRSIRSSAFPAKAAGTARLPTSA